MSAAIEIRDIDIDQGQKKRLGQYFTGIRLAKLLASLAGAQGASSIIDPMCGNGDMLKACLEIGATPKTLAGVEIHPSAYSAAVRRFADLPPKNVHLILGNAFNLDSIGRLPSQTYDLVITNPPYVRYQSQNNKGNDELGLPDAQAIRDALSSLVHLFPSLDESDKRLFTQVIANYSGLSDLAVPAWLLCAMLTRIGGTLAMVVPNAWLSRDYARAIQYVLLRWFKIVYVVEDENAAWFQNALVKTTLIVAKRTERRDSAFSWDDEGFVTAHLSAEAMNGGSIVGNLFPESPHPEATLSELLSRQVAKRTALQIPALSVNWIPLSQQAQNLQRGSVRNEWIFRLENVSHDLQLFGSSGESSSVSNNGNEVFLHPLLSSWIGTHSASRFSSPALLGINVGQGLRTGANRFFYVDATLENPEWYSITPDSSFSGRKVRVPADCLLPVLRRQSELPPSFDLSDARLSGRVLALHSYVLPEHQPNGAKRSVLKTMPDELAALVRIAALTNIGTNDEPKFVPELSAVRTNERNTDSDGSQSGTRHWYMLPDFKPRHRPDLFVARVNSLNPKTFMNSAQKFLIDANFSTIWVDEKSRIRPHALLAMLNSTWCVTAMELTGTVMGGGALKLEATHLRRLPIPTLPAAQWKKLDALGKALCECSSPEQTLKEIDAIVLTAIQPEGKAPLDLSRLEDIKNEHLRKRLKRQ